MPSPNEINECMVCKSQLSTSDSYRCSHCLVFYCRQCLIRHQHNDIKVKCMDMANEIDKILTRFLNHAHSQTEWTGHLTGDRNQLEIIIRYIENAHKDYPIIGLPSLQWMNHVDSLIFKMSFAIHEKCSTLLYSNLTPFIQL
ncbi:unnamed protein product [Adineta steineri]|uniref:Uncharacterized protein n=1 Tax=Adineta steineri TaxID=433720 RepID=A0A819TPG9_9BILA|nr:unnamed protein product [Adineta steineri]CAF4080960.1 unnamed protein product [Adineta steineri]